MGDRGPGEGTTNLDGHRLNFVTLRADSDLTELLKGLPNDWCCSDHANLADTLLGKACAPPPHRVRINPTAPGDLLIRDPVRCPQQPLACNTVRCGNDVDLDI